MTAVGFSAASARLLGTQRPPRGALATALSERVRALMEGDFRTRTDATGAPVACAAEAFGVRPEGLARAAEATTIYAWVYCRPVRPGGRGLSTPVAVRLDGTPNVRVPSQGDDRERSLQRIFPADVRPALQAVDPAALRAVVDDRIAAGRPVAAGG